jgi:alpha-galactosidase
VTAALPAALAAPPDLVDVQTPQGWVGAAGPPELRAAGGVTVRCTPGPAGLSVGVRAAQQVSRIWLRWRVPLPPGIRVLGDHWERSYGDLEWRGPAADRPLPWYAVLTGPAGSTGVGVRTRPAAWCAFAVDEAGIGLLLDLRSGSEPCRPGDREIPAAVVTTVAGDDPYDTTAALCAALCPDPVLPTGPVYGGNNWYHAYGVSSAAQMTAEAEFHSGLSDAPVRPYCVIDDGWQSGWAPGRNGGPWESGNSAFGDMAALTARIAGTGAVPGIWLRPLLEPAGASAGQLRTADGGAVADPSRPEVLARVAADVARVVDWGHRLVKHDFSTVDVTGRWGSEMGWDPVAPGTVLADRTRTTVEILDRLYATIAAAAGPAAVLGCNTVGHLAAGRFALQRTGDDTSGVDFARTRTTGVNTLAFRLPQHGRFFAVDADCVGVTAAIDPRGNRDWLDLVARSGTALFVSVDPATAGPDLRAALADAYRVAAAAPAPGRPLDWTDTAVPALWALADGPADYDWYPGSGRPLLP